MTVHILTEQVTLHSQVIVVAPPGERPEVVIKDAIKQVTAVREIVGLTDPPAYLHISDPIFKEGRRWLVRITYRTRISNVVEV